MNKEVMLVAGSGQISMAIARRVGFGKKIILGDKKEENAKNIAKIMNDAGFDCDTIAMDVSDRNSVIDMIKRFRYIKTRKYKRHTSCLSTC